MLVSPEGEAAAEAAGLALAGADAPPDGFALTDAAGAGLLAVVLGAAELAGGGDAGALDGAATGAASQPASSRHRPRGKKLGFVMASTIDQPGWRGAR